MTSYMDCHLDGKQSWQYNAWVHKQDIIRSPQKGLPESCGTVPLYQKQIN